MNLQQRELFIENVVWREHSAFAFSGVPDLAEAAVALASLSGQFAVHLEEDGRHCLARDPLGVNKLFFAVRGEEVASSNYLIDLLARGYGLAEVSSVPFGHAAFINTGLGKAALRRYSDLTFNASAVCDGDDEEWAGRIRQALGETFRKIRQVASGRRVYITMSGGLDSTIVALLARECLDDVHGVTFRVATGNGIADADEDAHFAERVAKDLSIPLTVVTATAEDVLSVLDEVLVWGQDWRDFNVHCGLVNALIGKELKKKIAPTNGGAARPLLLTGDTMNEMMADYLPVKYGEHEFYKLPRLSPGQLRRYLVRGLDSGDREVGILARMGFSVIQPYAMCVHACLSIPAAYLERADAKQRIFRRILGDRIPEYVLGRPKTRAQAASPTHVGGTLGVLHGAGMDQDFLRRRWCELFRLRLGDLDGLIRAGVYKCSIRSLPWE